MSRRNKGKILNLIFFSNGNYFRVVVAGFLRPELNFSSLEDLKAAIASDIVNAKNEIGKKESEALRDDQFFNKQ